MRTITFSILSLFLIACAGNHEETEPNREETAESDSIVDLSDGQSTVSDKVTEYHPNGNIRMEGKLNENGERDGLWISYYDDGSKWSESYYNNGLKDGHSITFFPNGQVRYVGEYKNDQKVGTWTFYDESGELVTEETFED